MAESRCEVHAAVMKDLEVFGEKMDRKTQKMDDLSTRVRQLEISNAKYEEQMNNVLEKIDSLMDSIQRWMNFVQACFWKALGLAGTVIMIFVGFFIWYIQHLPSGVVS